MATRFRIIASAIVSLALGLSLAAPPDAKPHRFAVLVGVKDYEHSKLTSLAYSEADATVTADLLKSHGYDVVLLTDSEGTRDAGKRPTRANIVNHLNRVLDQCKKHDTVLVGLAGHGLQFEADKASYFCPVDAHPSKPETLVSLKLLYEKLDESGAGVKLLLVDACRDDPLGGRGRGIDGDTAPKPPKGVAALFSCSGGERAFEHDKLKHGVFFYHVIEGLKGKAKTEDNEVTWDSLRAYVKRQVSREVPILLGGGARQHPNEVGNLSGEPPVLVKLSGSTVAGTKLKSGTTETPKSDARAYESDVFTSNGKKLRLIIKEGKLSLLNLDTKVPVGIEPESRRQVDAAGTSHDGSRFAFVDDKGAVEVWDIAMMFSKYKFKVERTKPIQAICTFPDPYSNGKEWVAVASAEALRVFDETGKEQWRNEPASESDHLPYRAIRYTSGQVLELIGSQDKVVQFDAITGRTKR